MDHFSAVEGMSFLSSVAAKGGGGGGVGARLTASICFNYIQTKQHPIKYYKNMHIHYECGVVG